MIDADDDTPPGHTRRPSRHVVAPKGNKSFQRPKLGTMAWAVMGLIVVGAVVAGFTSTPTEQDNYWVLLAVGAVALSVTSNDSERPAISGFSVFQLLELIFFSFKYVIFAGLISLPGLYLGVTLRDHWGGLGG